MTIQDVLAVLKRVRRQGSGWRACCPVHDDHNPSLSIVEKDGPILLHCHAGCSFDSVRAAILRLGGKDKSRNTEKPSGVVSSPELSVSEDAAAGRPQLRLQGGWADAAGYNYEDDLGRFLFQVVRRERLHLDGTVEKKRSVNAAARSDDQPAAEEWMYNLDGVPRVLYDLRELGGASLVYVVEGEKDVETLRSIGLVATCNPGGAGKWRAEYNHYLRDKTVVILPDNDEPKQPIKGNGGRITDYQDVIDDYGALEKRAFIQEPEFARVLRVISREGNTLSAVLRQAWDSDSIRTIRKSGLTQGGQELWRTVGALRTFRATFKPLFLVSKLLKSSSL